MKKQLQTWTLLGLILVLLAASCSQAVNPDWVAQAGLFSDPDGTQPTGAYGWLDTFYLVLILDEAPEDTLVRVSWIAVDTTRLSPDTVIKIDEQTAASRVLVFELENDGNFWPVGNYQVNIYLDQKLYQELRFEVYHTDVS